MLSPTAAQDRAAALIDFARAAGADAADAVYSGSSSESVAVRLGNLEDVERSEAEHLDLRVFCGRRSASIGSSDLSDAALKELAARAVDMARAAPEDQYAGLADQDLLFKGPFPELDVADPRELSPTDLRERALAIEDAARAVAGVTNSEGGHASLSARNFALVTSHGFAGSFGGTMHGVSATAIAGEGGNMQRDYAWRIAHHLEDLPELKELGRLAGERAVRRMNPGRVKSGPMPVVFDPRVGGSLISLMMSKWVAKRTTGAHVIDQPRNEAEQWLVGTVRRQAEAAGIKVPEVAIYDAPEINAFATGPSRNNSLVAVSTGLLRSPTAHREAETAKAHRG